MFRFAKGVQEDDAKANEWFTKAANQGHAEAQTILGDMYYVGKGTNGGHEDYTMAFKWYTKAA